jgi:hypothetical protein
MKKAIAILAVFIGSIVAAQINSVRSPLVLSNGVLSHGDADGQDHVPKTYGVGSGYVLTTHGLSGDAFWAPLSGVSVSSVFGRSGAVTAQTGDYTAAQVGAEPSLGNPTVSGYVLSSTTTGTRYWAASGTGNVLATKLVGFSSGPNSSISAADSILSGFAKTQGQIDGLGSRFQPLENQRLSTSYSPTFAGLTLVNSSWEQPIARTTSGTAGAGWQIEDPSQKWSFQIRQDGLSGSTAHSWSIDDITANVLRVWGNATRTVFKTEVNVDGAISEGGTYLSSKYLGISGNALTASRWNSPITIAQNQDVSWSVSVDGSSTVTSPATVVGLRGVGIPSPTTGNLRYNGANFIWDGTNYAQTGTTATFSSLKVSGLPQYTIPRVTDGAGTFGTSSITDDGGVVRSSKPVHQEAVGSDVAGGGAHVGVFADPTSYKGGFLQRSAADNLDVWVGNVGASNWLRAARFGTDQSTTLYGPLTGTSASLSGSISTGGTIRQDAAGNGSMGNLWTDQVRFRRAGYADSTYFHTVVNNTNGDLLFQRYTPAFQATDLNIDVNGDMTIANNVNMVAGWLNTHGAIYVNGSLQTSGITVSGSSVFANSTTSFDGVGFVTHTGFQFDSSVVATGSVTASGSLSVTGKFKPHAYVCNTANCTLPYVEPGEERLIIFDRSTVSLNTYPTQSVDARDQNGIVIHTPQNSNFWQGPANPFGFGSTYSVNAAHLIGVSSSIAQLIY